MPKYTIDLFCYILWEPPNFGMKKIMVKSKRSRKDANKTADKESKKSAKKVTKRAVKEITHNRATKL